MDTADLRELFGDPSETLAAEAVHVFNEEHDDWPTWDETIDSLAAFPSVDSEEEAEERLCQAVCNGEVYPRLRDVGADQQWTIRIPDKTAELIERRVIALRTSPLPDEEDAC